ncbi:MAG: hypothetical protein ABIX37_09450 [Gammaproteobacteria bacterium]
MPSPDIDRRGCRRVQALILGATLLALIASSRGGLPAPLGGLVALLIVGHAYREWHRTSPRSAAYVSRLRVMSDGRFLIALGPDQDTRAPMTLASSWTLPGMAVGLAFAGEGSPRTEAILFRHRVSPEAWRRLAVRLRHAPHATD